MLKDKHEDKPAEGREIPTLARVSSRSWLKHRKFLHQEIRKGSIGENLTLPLSPVGLDELYCRKAGRKRRETGHSHVGVGRRKRARDENKKGESLKSQSPFSADKWAVSSDSVTQRTNAWHESVCCSVHL